MFKYKCEDCGEILTEDELDRKKEIIYHSEVDTRCVETLYYTCCPCCRSDELTEIWEEGNENGE